MTRKEFSKRCKDEKEKTGKDLTPNFFMNAIIDHFLGDGWYSMYWNQDDIYMDAVDQIITLHPEPFHSRFGRKLKLIWKVIKGEIQ